MNQVHIIALNQIRPAPWNPPSRMDPANVQGMADSIKQVGQESPALIRPVEADPPVKYELVWGHRRYAAQRLIMEETGEITRLKTFIREMSQEQAMIASAIENLQREEFSDIEEAEFFRTCGEQYGESAVDILSEKLSISHRYIRKRIEILKLPEEALELWRTGVWHVGHMEQLLRLGDDVGAFLELIENHRRDPEDISVWDLRELIDRRAIPLHSGNFSKADCKTCPKNTDTQFSLFGELIGVESEKTKCLNPKCFVEKQQAWVDLNWLKCKENKYGTQAAIIGDHNTETTGEFSEWSSPKPAAKCKSCPHFATVLGVGERRAVWRDRVCMGPPECFAEVKKGEKQKANGGNGNGKGDGPRVAWHGEYYRQEFYHQEIPQLMESLPDEDPRRLQLALAAIVYSAKGIHEWFCEQMGVEIEKPEYSCYFALPFHRILELASAGPPARVEQLMGQALVQIALRKDRGYETSFADQDRQAIAEFLEVDFDNFQVTEEYLKKKTKAELVKFIAHESSLMEEPEFKGLMVKQGYPTPENLAQAKKGVLVDLILNCGIDLRGRLPKEIADRPELGAE